MSGQWKPGDVAIADGCRMMRTSNGWLYASPGPMVNYTHAEGESADRVTSLARPLVVIDPARNPFNEGTAGWIDWIENQYRAQTAPPKPEEPTGLGAVVVDADGLQWVRSTYADAGYYGWRCANRPQESALYRWLDIDAVEVIREGWSE